MKFHSWNGMRKTKGGKGRGIKGIDNKKKIHIESIFASLYQPD